MKKILIMTALFSLSFGVFAQRGESRDFPSPEERAERMTNRMAERLELSDDQKEKIYALNLENAQIRNSEMEARRAEMEKLREARTESRKQQQEQIEAILTPEQKEKWNDMKGSDRRRGPMMHKRGGGERGSEMRKGNRGYGDRSGKKGHTQRPGRRGGR